MVLCVPAIDIRPVQTVIDFDKTDIEVAAQNVYFEPSGAYTGEISIPMIKDAGCTYSIVGHSERREYFAETDETVNLKVKALVADGLVRSCAWANRSRSVMIIAISNSLWRRCVPRLLVSMRKTLHMSLLRTSVWAIGTGRTATPEQAEEVCAAIRQTIADMFTAEAAEAIRILYGGSMNTGNVDSLLAMADIDGGLIGGAALDADSFKQLIEAAAKASEE